MGRMKFSGILRYKKKRKFVIKWIFQGSEKMNVARGELGQNIQKNPGDLRRLAVTQTPMKAHQVIVV